MPAYSAVVSPSGGDYSTLSAAIAALSAGASILVKPGTYTDAVDVSKAVMVQMAPGTSFTHASGFAQSGVKSGVLWGNGCSVPNGPYTQSGADSWSKARNGLKTQGMIVSGARAFHDGGGWGTRHNGSTVRHGVSVSAADVIVQNANCGSNIGSAGIGFTASGARTTARLVQVNGDGNGYEEGFYFSAGADDGLIEGCQTLNVYNKPFHWNAPRLRLLASHAQNLGVGNRVTLEGGADNSVVVGNVFEYSSPYYPTILIDAACEDNVVVANRVFSGAGGAIADASGTSTVQYNDLGTASCAVTGTLADGCNESDIVAGGQTLILTLSGAVWRNDLDAAGWVSAFRALLSGNRDGAAVGFDDVKTTLLASGTVVRTSDTVVTLTLAAAGTYALNAGLHETLSLAALDNSVLGSEDTLTPATVAFTVTEGA